MSTTEFAADIDPERGWPRVRFNFKNGWAASMVLRTSRKGMDAMQASVACCPTGHWGEGLTELGPTEATADEAIEWLNAIRLRETAEVRRAG